MDQVINKYSSGIFGHGAEVEISHTVLSTDAETHKQIRVKISLQQCIRMTTEGTNETQTEPDLAVTVLKLLNILFFVLWSP